MESLKLGEPLDARAFSRFEQLCELGRQVGFALVEVGGDGEVDHGADLGSGGLLHLLVDEDEVAAVDGVGEERGAEDFAADFDADAEADHLLPRVVELEGERGR